MVSGPSPINGFSPTPTIRFQPDPGEPAAQLTAREQQTALLVSNQEQRNETRLRAQAIARGEDVLFSNRTFTLGVGQISPVFNGGLTTVQTRTDSNGFVPDTLLGPDPARQENPLRAEEEEAPDEEEDSATDTLTSATEPSEEELEQEEQSLDTEEARLERNLTQAALEQEQALQENDPVQFAQARREEQQLEREQEELEEEQRDVELQRLEDQLQDVLAATTGAIEDSADAALGLVGVLFGVNQDGQTSPDRNLLNEGGPGFFARGPRI